jgi:hypothetical protein
MTLILVVICGGYLAPGIEEVDVLEDFRQIDPSEVSFLDERSGWSC